MLALEPSIQMWASFAVIAVAIVSYATDRVSMEVTSIATIAALLILFHMAPLTDAAGRPALRLADLLAGFASPALITIMALLVIGQALVQTGALDEPARRLVSFGASYPRLVTMLSLALVMLLSAIMNNTPVVVIFIPILSALSEKLDHTVSHVMIPLSYAAILGGNMTLIGSSTNLLVAGELELLTGRSIDFFEFTIPGLILAVAGYVYIALIAPRLLEDRATMADQLAGRGGKQFIVQMEVTRDSALDGQQAKAGMFPGLKDMTVRLVQRGEQAMLPPFEDITLRPGDMVIVAATRSTLTETLARWPSLFKGAWSEAESSQAPGTGTAPPEEDRVLAEAVVAPASRMGGRTLAQIGFRAQTGCLVLGIQRRSRMIRSAMSTIRLEAGDVLLIMGRRKDVLGLRSNRDVLLLEWSAAEMPMTTNAGRALAIFAGVVATAASGMVPITIAAVVGATLMIITGCINVRQASRAMDRRVIFIVAAALAMGTALSQTGGAEFLAQSMLGALRDAAPIVILSAFFLLVALLTNVLSNNATAVLFTPIAISIAEQIGVDPMVFVVAVIFAANCSFATPMGYQTNLLVMGPGHYRFSDFVRVGAPLVFILWSVFTMLAPWYYDLN